MRRVVRAAVQMVRKRLAEEDRGRERAEQYKAERARKRREAQEWYLTAPKGVFRAFYHQGEFVAAAMMDADLRESRDITDLAAFREALEGLGLVAGIDPLADFERLCIAPGERKIVDLSPPVKGITDSLGRRRPVTLKEVMRSSLGRRHVLAGEEKLADWHERRKTSKLLERLRRDVLELSALFEYGALHGYVLIRSGRYFVRRPVYWNHGMFPDIFVVLSRAAETGEVLEFRVQAPPRCGDPDSLKVVGCVVGLDSGIAVIETDPAGFMLEASVDLIFAVGPARK